MKRKSHDGFIACVPRSLPQRLHVAAAQTARRVNPVNAPPPVLAGLAEATVLGPQQVALLTSKYWGPTPRKLTVSFLERTPNDLQKRILSHMNAWSTRCGISFALTGGAGAVRISLRGGGYWSYLGTDILHIPRNRPTMNLEAFSMDTPEAEYRRVVRHETGHCLAAGTLIDCPRDLKKHPLGIPISELVGEQPWVYAWRDGRMVVRQASRVWLSKRNVPTVRVRLRTGRGYHNGQFRPPLELVGTPDHPVLLADGVTWRNLGDLRVGDRLCSLYRSKNGTRSRIKWTGLGDRVPEHVFVAEQVFGARPEHHDCHHKDENQLNQSVGNLEWKDESAHHSDHARGRRRSAEAVAASAAWWRGRHHTDESKARMAESHRQQAPPSAETRKKIGDASRGKKQTAEHVGKRTASMRRFYDSGGRSGMLGKTASEETRRKRSESMKKTLAAKKAANHVVVSVEPWLSQDVYDMTVPDADSFVANGVVVHNSLGMPHEHMRRALVELLDPDKTIAWMRREYGWDAQTVREQVLTPLDERSLMATPADDTSIMCYQLSGACTRDGRPIPGGLDINESDYAFAARIYPKSSLVAMDADVQEEAEGHGDDWPEDEDVRDVDLLA